MGRPERYENDVVCREFPRPTSVNYLSVVLDFCQVGIGVSRKSHDRHPSRTRLVVVHHNAFLYRTDSFGEQILRNCDGHNGLISTEKTRHHERGSLPRPPFGQHRWADYSTGSYSLWLDPSFQHQQPQPRSVSTQAGHAVNCAQESTASARDTSSDGRTGACLSTTRNQAACGCRKSQWVWR
jgi:hypothetical protein